MKRVFADDGGLTVVEMLILIAVIGIVAAITVPRFLRVRISANEAQAIGETRIVLSANQAYASANCGFFAENLECLTRGDGSMARGICIKNYPSDQPEFLSGHLAKETPYTKSGYRRDYIKSGEVMPSMMTAGHCDDMSALDFCYTAVPVSPGSSGVRSFSGIGSGRIYVDPGGARIACPVPGTTPYLE